MTMNDLTNKYGMTSSKLKFESFRDSREVEELSYLLKEYPEFGISLRHKNGIPSLKFEPPLNNENQIRKDFADTIIEMLIYAREDLIYMIKHGLIKLKLSFSWFFYFV